VLWFFPEQLGTGRHQLLWCLCGSVKAVEVTVAEGRPPTAGLQAGRIKLELPLKIEIARDFKGVNPCW